MNNIQSNGRVNIKSNGINVSQQQSIQLDKQSPEELKKQLESGEINETDFPSKEDFEKFVIFLTRMLQEEIKLGSKNATNHENKAELVLKNTIVNTDQNKKERVLEQSVNKTAHVEEQEIEHDKPYSLAAKQHVSSIEYNDMEIQKELLGQLFSKQQMPIAIVSNENIETKQMEMELFKAGNIEKPVIQKEHSLFINDKMVTLHTAGGNNLSILGSELSAQGDSQFLNETRSVAQEEGFKEKGRQHQSSEDEGADLDKIYFSKDNEQ